MESLETQQKAISLGKQLVKELSRDAEADTVSRWMAHYIAELITIAESASAADKKLTQQKCFESIALLWKHRAFFPNGRRPFEEFEPVLNALARLSPEEERSFYHHVPATRKPDEEAETDHVQQLIEFVFMIDNVARILISELLNEATREATSTRTKQLLQDATSFSPGLDVETLNIILSEGEYSQKDLTSDNARKKVIQDRINKLDLFCELSLEIRKRYTAQLGKT